MSKFRFTLNMLALAIFTLTVAATTQAQATRTWVSGVGDDVNPCSRTAPCKTYAGAISKTADKGEISTLDPGGFGAVTITKNLTIDGTNGQGFGSILASGTSGVIINDSLTPTPNTVVVTLRNLSINGASTTAGSGIRFIAGKSLIVENCVISGFTGTGTVGRGISVELTSSTPKNVYIKDTNITNCTVGVRIGQTASFVAAVLDNVNIDAVGDQVAGTTGVELATGGFAVVRDSTISRFQNGINNTGGAASGTRVIGSLLFSNANGINAGASQAHISSSQFLGNTAGVALAGGSVLTGCDNFFAGNTSDVTGGGLTNQCVK
ncbi:MAG TPA: hypothetical protein VFM63_07470 [Pyrinomonadaceae bacterium]|nr:hypothetical protein [Pyrinomonadaceae bacterium]